MSFSQAVSGLSAASSNLDVIGNNIANSATVGFKTATLPDAKWMRNVRGSCHGKPNIPKSASGISKRTSLVVSVTV